MIAGKTYRETTRLHATRLVKAGCLLSFIWTTLSWADEQANLFGPSAGDKFPASDRVSSSPLIINFRPSITESVGSLMPNQGSIPSAITEADQLAGNGRWNQALDKLLHAYIFMPENSVLMEKTGLLHIRNKQWRLANDIWQHLARQQPDDADLLTLSAQCQLMMGKTREARQRLNEAVRIDSTYLPARFWLLCVQIASGEDHPPSDLNTLPFDKLRWMVRWTDLYSTDLVELLHPEGYAELVMQILGISMESTGKKPADEDSSAVRGKIHAISRCFDMVYRSMNNGFYPESLKALDELSSYKIDAPGLTVARAQTLVYLGRFDESLSLMGGLSVNYSSQPKFLCDYGLIALQAGQLDMAENKIVQAHSLAPENNSITFSLACVLSARDQVNKAWPLLQALAGRDLTDLRMRLCGDDPWIVSIRKHPGFSDLLGYR